MTLLIVAASLLALARASGPQASCAVGQRCAAGEQDDTGMLSMLQKSSQRMPVTRHEQSSVKTTTTAPSQPNIVIALIDDLGWDDVHQGDDGLIRTPHMDQLALEEGIYLKRQYSYNWCGPSRSSIMTGRLPTHVYFAHVDSLAINPANPGIAAGAPTGMSMISDKMKGAGYSTVYHGKWGVGLYRDLSGLHRHLSGLCRHLSGLYRHLSMPYRDLSELYRDLSRLYRDSSGLYRDLSGLYRDLSGLYRDLSGPDYVGICP